MKEITNRELQVLQLLTQEYTSLEIAERLYLSKETVLSHRKNIRRKFNAKNTAGLISKAFRQGIMVSFMTICLFSLSTTDITAQTRNLHVEGTGDQYGVIQTTDLGTSKAGVELLRGSEFNGSDWRIINDGGTLMIENGSNNFMTDGNPQFSVGFNGVVNIFNGSDAVVDQNNSGTLILGDPNSFHLAVDNNGIIARNDEIGSQLLLQTGVDKGDTYLNNESGQVGIGTTTPQAKLGIEDAGFQIRMANADDLTNEWFIGASRSGWAVGPDKLVFSPTGSSNDAMLILNNEDDVISARSHRIANVADPTVDRDAVNLRTLRDFTRVTDISTIFSNQTFRECATTCRDLTQADQDDWHVPSLEEIAQFVEVFESSNAAWTSSFGTTIVPTGGGIIIPEHYYATIRLEEGDLGIAQASDELQCRCVR